MRVDREQYAALVREKANGQDNRVHLEALIQAEVKVEHVTGDPHWDTFLSYVQAAIEKSEEELGSLKTMLESPHMVAPDDIMRLKIAIVSCRSRLSAWDVVIALPRDIKEHGEKARALLDVMEDADDE